MSTDLVIALAGNANVGKSSIYNQLTGLGQVIGNWPGKTVEKAEGILVHHGKRIKIIDLPGIYSLSTYSEEEIISRDYIALHRPDAVVNVVDATALERNLFFTLQLLEMEIPLVISLNLFDITKKKGLHIDSDKLQKMLGIPVIPTIATKGVGVHELIDEAIDTSKQKPHKHLMKIRYGPEIEKRIEKLILQLSDVKIQYPLRWTAIKLLEEDAEITKKINKNHPDIVIAAKILSEEISQIHKEPCSTVIASERYAVAARIAKEVQTMRDPTKPSAGDRLDALSMHSIWGYVLMFTLMLSILAFISLFGEWVAEHIEMIFELFTPQLSGIWSELLWNGAVVGFYATLAIAIGFILPFYLILGILEDSGYLPKIAYLMDRPCHSMGLHGKACMPLLLGLGCNVPACLGCRIMETKRDRLIAVFLSTLVPCSARTAVILGLVGAFVGIQWAIGLYIFQFILILVIGRILNKILPGTSVGIIMEMPPYRRPSARVVLSQAWNRFKPFLLYAFPIIIGGSIIIEGLRITGFLSHISNALSPITVTWLGLPAFTGFLLIFGILRKEAVLVLLATAAGTLDVSTVMTPVQMVVFALVMMIYIPCVATIAVLIREAGWKNTLLITISEISLAIFLGGIVYRILSFFM